MLQYVRFTALNTNDASRTSCYSTYAASLTASRLRPALVVLKHAYMYSKELVP